MRLGSYIRVSKVNGRTGESFISPEVQLDYNRRAAADRAAELVEYEPDLDESGGKASRPSFNRILQAIEDGDLDGLVVWKADRFARSMKVAWDCVERIQAAGGAFISATENVDLLSPEGRLQFNVVMMMAQYQRDSSKRGWADARERAFERGAYLGRTPLGYARGESGRLEIDPVTGPVVQEAFRMKGRGESWAAVARYMTEALGGIRGKQVNSGTVRAMYPRRCYLGELRADDGRTKQAHPALVTHDEWRAAQATPTVVTSEAQKSRSYLLAGMIRCAGCRYLMRARPISNHGRKAYVYECRRHHAAGECPEPATIMVEPLDAWATEQLFERHEVILRAFSEGVDLEGARAAVREAEEELEAFGKMAARSKRPEFLEAALAEREEALGKAERALRQAEAVYAPPAEVGGVFNVRDRWPDYSVEQKRRALASVMDRIVVKRRAQGGNQFASEPIEERALILWQGEEAEYGTMPSRGRVVAVEPFPFELALGREGEAGVALGLDVA
jgi:site-specific DNA recombinase